MPKYTLTIAFIAASIAIFLCASSACADTTIHFVDVEKTSLALAPAKAAATTIDPGLPDHDAVVQSAWDDWQAHIVNELSARVKMMARLLPPSVEPLEDKVSFSVESDGSLADVHLDRCSNNKYFNMICVVAVNSLQGNSLLKYPKGSSSTRAQKSISFTLLPTICAQAQR